MTPRTTLGATWGAPWSPGPCLSPARAPRGAAFRDLPTCSEKSLLSLNSHFLANPVARAQPWCNRHLLVAISAPLPKPTYKILYPAPILSVASHKKKKSIKRNKSRCSLVLQTLLHSHSLPFVLPLLHSPCLLVCMINFINFPDLLCH